MSNILADSRITEHVTLGRLLFLTAGIALVKFRHQIYRPIRNWSSPLRHLPGPDNDSWILGHFITLIKDQSGSIWGKWTEKHGGTFCFRGFFGSYQLCTIDMRAVNYILTHNMSFPKPEATRKALAQLIGQGILSANEETHKRQRRIMNPAFGALHIRDLVPIFWAKTNKLRDIWFEMIRDHPEGTEIDVAPWLTRATLDTIGVAGFGYEFRSLEDEDKDALAKAFMEIFNSNENIGALEVIKGLLFYYIGIHTASAKRVDDNLATVRRIGMGLVEDKKLLFQEGKEGEEAQGRDLLTLLIKSNLANDVGMSDEEVFGQISTFLTAGHETTSSSTTWALYALAKHPEVQAKLREELQTAGLGDEPTMDELEKLSYLNNFMREALRLYPVVPLGGREAAMDMIIPVGQSFVDAHGVVQTEIRVQKGDSVAIPILAMNRAKELWGEDALEFKPGRWDNLPNTVKDMPGVWGHQMTFFAGPHACIGYRFAVVEMKTLIYALVRSFEFEIDPHIEVEGKTGLATRPVVKGDKESNRMPLICKAATKV